MKKILTVFETAFRHGWRGSTSRVLDIARSLDERGWEFGLLAGDRNMAPAGADQEAVLQGWILRTPFAGIYPNHVSSRWARKLYRDWLYLTSRSHLYRNPEFGWGEKAAAWYPGQERPLPDLVMGMSTGQIGNLVAARKLSESFRVPLVLEFQDPCPAIGLKKIHDVELLALEKAMNAADLVLTTTRSLADHMEREYPGSRARFAAVHMCFDPAQTPETRTDHGGAKRIVHAGSLAGGAGRNVRILVEGMATAVAEDPRIREQVKLVLVGAGDGGTEAGALAESLGIGQLVELIPEVPMDESLEIMAGADVLLVVKYADPVYSRQIPGKLFQYLGQGRPILGLMPPESEAAGILKKSGLAVICDNDDLEGVAGFVRKISTDARAVSDGLKPDREYISGFSRDAMGRRLDELLGDLPEHGRYDT